jgi:mediator of RNA polymerase II transcription subunit 23
VKFWGRLHHSLPFVLITSLFLQAETTVINQCNQLLSPSAEPNYVMTYLSHSFPQHRQYLCAGAWMLMNGHLEINSANLVCFNYSFNVTVICFSFYVFVS